MPTKDELVAKLASRRKKRVKYHGLGRYLCVLAGTLRMIAPENIAPALRNAERGDWAGVATRLNRLFMDPTFKERAEGAAVMAIGVGTGKVLDKAQVNPKIEVFNGQGLKLW